jgi:hypothetical protein
VGWPGTIATRCGRWTYATAFEDPDRLDEASLPPTTASSEETAVARVPLLLFVRTGSGGRALASSGLPRTDGCAVVALG